MAAMTTDPRQTCDSEIVGRDGKPLPYHCNLPAGHLGGHAQTYETTTDERTTTA